MNRKDFIKASCLACGAAATMGLLDRCKKTALQVPDANFTLDLGSAANSVLNTQGGSLVNSQVIVIRLAAPLAASSFVALSQICTHNACSVAYYNSTRTLICPCHGGTYDTGGNVISGPPQVALKKYNVSLSGNYLKITS